MILSLQVVIDVKDWESNLKNLNESVKSIKNMLLDMDSKSELTHEEQGWVEALVNVLYDADDLLDKVITTAKMKELHNGDGDDSDEFFKKVLDEVCRFFSCINCIRDRYNISQEVKSIQLNLDAIASNHDRYKSNAGVVPRNYDHQATLEAGTDTTSLLDENIIGREGDVNVIVDMLLDPNVEENVGYVVIVGIGGLGKTTLAQLVYNHDMIQTKFDKKLWVCVSDHDGEGFNVNKILKNIIELSTKIPCNLSTRQSLQLKLKEELETNTYLLILDNVWTENCEKWKELKKCLTIGEKGSRVVITSRSENTAQVILGKYVHSRKYMLKGLSNENSWRLFMDAAFELEADKANDPEFIKIGKKIVVKCSNIPLAIKVVGNLLNGKTHKWELFEKNRLPQIEPTSNSIMSILKLSYDNLEPNIKSCFRYCALFPKDFVMDKQNLISLWYAQGYIIGDSDEDYFLILLKRCFFQDVTKSRSGDIISVKMHDLMHDLAQELSGDEIIVDNSLPNILSKTCKKSRHLFLDTGELTESSSHDRNIQTCNIDTMIHSDVVTTLVVSWYWLRSLCLYVPDCEFLPESIGELLHLRYLDLSRNMKLSTLPNSIAKLYNLKCLVMHFCTGFYKWPKDFCKLVNLRLLDIRWCVGLTCMPLGIDQLTNLHNLTNFRVSDVSSTEEESGGQLKDLKSLVNLRGKIDISIHGYGAIENENVCNDYYLKDIKNLKVVSIWMLSLDLVTNQEALIVKLQPSEYLLELKLHGYEGTEIPRWGRAHDDWAIILPKLVKIELSLCTELHGIPLLRNLKLLKFLSLYVLKKLEYVEISGSSGSNNISFFPSLEYLRIQSAERLKEWRGGVGESDSCSSNSHWLPPFPRLLTLEIIECPELTSFPPCPSLKSLQVIQSKNLLRISPDEGHGNLDISHCPSLQSLEINGCTKLTSVLGALEHLTALRSLSLGDRDVEVDFSDMPWGSLHHNLRSLELNYLDTLQILPKGMKHLTALENLIIKSCISLKELPEWISCLSSLHSLTIESCSNLKSLGTIQYITSLQKLEIKSCPELKEACEEPSGREWPKIQHIPHISFIDR